MKNFYWSDNMDKDKMYFFTNSILNIIGEDVNFIFTNNDSYVYTDNKIYIPLELRIREMNRHHICWVKDKFDLDIKKYNYPLELTYHILSLLHEVGHKISINRGDFDYLEDKKERVKYLDYIFTYGDNYDMYRSIPSEIMADYYSSLLWKENEKDILRFLKIYGKILK